MELGLRIPGPFKQKQPDEDQIQSEIGTAIQETHERRRQLSERYKQRLDDDDDDVPSTPLHIVLACET